MDSLFVPEGDAFLPLEHTGAGWAIPMLHGGPVAALLAHAVELERTDPALLPARLTVDLLRPVPRKPLRLRTAVIRNGRRIRLVDAFVLDGETMVARASALLLRQGAQREQAQTLATHPGIPRRKDAPERHWSKNGPRRGDSFHEAVEVRRVSDWHVGTPMLAWARVPFDFLPGQPLTPFERAAALSDFANTMGMASQQGFPRVYINADITLSLLREPEGEWICLESLARADRSGLATSVINYHDERGFVGHSLVHCLDNPKPEDESTV